jgi:hypothetical protein
MKYAVEMASRGKINTPVLKKTGKGVKAVLTPSLRNLRGSNFGINGGRDLSITPLRWVSVT